MASGEAARRLALAVRVASTGTLLRGLAAPLVVADSLSVSASPSQLLHQRNSILLGTGEPQAWGYVSHGSTSAGAVVRGFATGGAEDGEDKDKQREELPEGGASDGDSSSSSDSDGGSSSDSDSEVAAVADGSSGAVASGTGGVYYPVPAKRGNLNEIAEDFEQYLADLPELPSDEPIYDLPTWLGDDYEQDVDFSKLLLEQMRIDPGLLDSYAVEPDAPPYPGAKKILRWTQHGVLISATGNAAQHPINKKVECMVHLQELQKESGLSDDAVLHIISICGPRYNASTGDLRLVSERYPDKEDNRRHIMQIIWDLLDEGHKTFPNADRQAAIASYRQQCKEEAEELGRTMAPEIEEQQATFEALVAEAQEAYKAKYGDLPESYFGGVTDADSLPKAQDST